MVEVDEVLRDAAAFGLVGLQDGAGGDAGDDGGDLPAQVVCVLHGDVHALAGFGGVRVDGVAGEEDPFLQAEAVAYALAGVVS